MFCDLVGSTALASTMDPEDLREIVRGYQAACATEIARYEGFIAQYLGDGILAYFGYPLAHEDDEEQAVRAGLGIIDAMATLVSPGGVRLQVRLGLATGVVVVGDVLADERAVVGETPNLAARLQGLAMPDSMVISPTTHRLLGAQFECVDMGEQQLKGFAQPVRAWRVSAIIKARSRFLARSPSLTALVDRVEERAVLAERAARVLKGGWETILLSGEGGIGKSRLAHSLLEALRAEHKLAPLELQCSPRHVESALYPVVEALSRTVFTGSASTDNGPARWQELTRYATQRNVEGDLPLLANLLSVPTPSGLHPLALTPDRQRQLTQELLLRLLRAHADGSPVVVLVEDIHWADPSTLELLDFLIAKSEEGDFLTLLTFRPEFQPRWREGPHLTWIPVGRLRPDDAAALVRGAIGHGEFNSVIVDRIVEKTDGVPLYLEEFAKTVAEANDVSGGASMTTDDIPATLRDSLLARLDRLGPAKSVAQVAGLLGRTFQVPTLRAVWSGDASAMELGLQRLIAADFVQSVPGRAVESFVFKHALIQDAACDSLLRKSRIALHHHIAEVLENRFPQILDTQPEIVARHYTAGGAPAKAVPFWLAAGRHALRRNAHAEAIAHLRCGLSLTQELPDDPSRALLELDLQITIGPALIAATGWTSPESYATWERASELCAIVGDVPQAVPALWGRWSVFCVRGSHHEAFDLAKRFLRLVQPLQDDGLLLEGYQALGNTQFYMGDFAGAIESFRSCHRLYNPARHGGHAYIFGQDPATVAAIYLAFCYAITDGDVSAENDRAFALVREIRHPLTGCFVLTLAAWRLVIAGEYAKAAPLIVELLELTNTELIPLFRSHAMLLPAWIACMEGDPQEGADAMHSELEVYERIGAGLWLPLWRSAEGFAWGRAGEPERGLRILDEAFARMAETGERIGEVEMWRFRGQLLEWSDADPARIEHAYRQGLVVAVTAGAIRWRLRSAISLARYLQRRGRHDEAGALVHAALADLPGEAGKDVDDANACLTASSIHST